MVFDFASGVGISRYRWLLYVFGVLLIVLILMMLGGVGLDRLTGKGSAPKELRYWKSYDPLIPLRVTPKETGPLEFYNYTVIVDMVWLNTRVTNANTTYRHIFHRGSGEGAEFQQAINDIRQVDTQTSTLTAADAATRMPQGLPIRMNPGVLADPVKNDMLIFIDTERDNERYRESVRIADIPMDEPFQLAIVVLSKMVEVYVNCGLEVTKMLEGRPLSIEGNWYGLVGPEPLNGVVQNLRIFGGALGSSQLRSYCTKPKMEAALSGCEKRQIQAQGDAAVSAST